MLLYNKKVCYIAHLNLPDENMQKYAKNMQNIHKSMYWHILHIYALPTLLMTGARACQCQWPGADREGLSDPVPQCEWPWHNEILSKWPGRPQPRLTEKPWHWQRPGPGPPGHCSGHRPGLVSILGVILDLRCPGCGRYGSSLRLP